MKTIASGNNIDHGIETQHRTEKKEKKKENILQKRILFLFFSL